MLDRSGASRCHEIEGSHESRRRARLHGALGARSVRIAAALLRGVILALALALPAAAQEYISVRGPLTDEDFYRVVACAARPGAPCRKPFLRWPLSRRADLTAAIAPGRMPQAERERYTRGLDAALREINAQAAGVRLRRVEGMADILVHVVATPPGRVMRQTGTADLDGLVLPLALVTVRARGGEIRSARIAVSAQAPADEIPSLLLEEVVQGLGLITDIHGTAYRRSIFAENGNAVVRLAGQDAMALRRHYEEPVLLAQGR